MDKINVAILGTGNIGCDLLTKVLHSDYLACSLFVGRRTESKGIEYAKSFGIKTSPDSISALEENTDSFDILFDTTNAELHIKNRGLFKKLDKFLIDLTPSQVGEMCVPIINLGSCLNTREVNLVSCGGQATIPMAWVVKQIYPEIDYIENVTAISSKSAGPATRLNIDNYIRTTQNAIMKFSGVKEAKVILNINPAVPPINMHNTTYVETKTEVDISLLNVRIKEMVKKVKNYVPGFNLFLGPIYENRIITIMNEVIGKGDYLSSYAGNLDIITCAAIAVAEEYAKNKIKRR